MSIAERARQQGALTVVEAARRLEVEGVELIQAMRERRIRYVMVEGIAHILSWDSQFRPAASRVRSAGLRPPLTPPRGGGTLRPPRERRPGDPVHRTPHVRVLSAGGLKAAAHGEKEQDPRAPGR